MNVNSRYTPFQRDIVRMIDALGIDLTKIGVADEALTRRIVHPDNGGAENVHVHNSTTSDPAGDEAIRRMSAEEQRSNYHENIKEIWTTIKVLRQATDKVLRNEPVIPHAGIVCATKICTNYASNHQHPDTNAVIDDVCDDCWRKLCPKCYLRPMDLYRPTCFTCYQRTLRQGNAA